MSDILRVFSKFKIIDSSFSVSFIEVSPYLSQVQEKNLCDPKSVQLVQPQLPKDVTYYKESTTIYGSPVRWYNHISDLPHTFTLFLAHEFFDALPIHKLVNTEQGWREVLVDLSPGSANLRYVLSRQRTPACLYCQV